MGTAHNKEEWIVRLTVVAVSIHVFEAALPSFFPGLKPGLANVITLIAFQLLGLSAACWITGLRVLAGSLFVGSFLTPGFFLSAAAGKRLARARP